MLDTLIRRLLAIWVAVVVSACGGGDDGDTATQAAFRMVGEDPNFYSLQAVVIDISDPSGIKPEYVGFVSNQSFSFEQIVEGTSVFAGLLPIVSPGEHELQVSINGVTVNEVITVIANDLEGKSPEDYVLDAFAQQKDELNRMLGDESLNDYATLIQDLLVILDGVDLSELSTSDLERLAFSMQANGFLADTSETQSLDSGGGSTQSKFSVASTNSEEVLFAEKEGLLRGIARWFTKDIPNNPDGSVKHGYVVSRITAGLFLKLANLIDYTKSLADTAEKGGELTGGLEFVEVANPETKKPKSSTFSDFTDGATKVIQGFRKYKLPKDVKDAAKENLDSLTKAVNEQVAGARKNAGEKFATFEQYYASFNAQLESEKRKIEAEFKRKLESKRIEVEALAAEVKAEVRINVEARLAFIKLQLREALQDFQFPLTITDKADGSTTLITATISAATLPRACPNEVTEDKICSDKRNHYGVAVGELVTDTVLGEFATSFRATRPPLFGDLIFSNETGEWTYTPHLSTNNGDKDSFLFRAVNSAGESDDARIDFDIVSVNYAMVRKYWSTDPSIESNVERLENGDSVVESDNIKWLVGFINKDTGKQVALASHEGGCDDKEELWQPYVFGDFQGIHEDNYDYRNPSHEVNLGNFYDCTNSRKVENFFVDLTVKRPHLQFFRENNVRATYVNSDGSSTATLDFSPDLSVTYTRQTQGSPTVTYDGTWNTARFGTAQTLDRCPDGTVFGPVSFDLKPYFRTKPSISISVKGLLDGSYHRGCPGGDTGFSVNVIPVNE